VNTRKYVEKYGVAPFILPPDPDQRESSEMPFILKLPTSAGRKLARIIFEAQLAYVIECTDLFVNDALHRKGKIH